MNFEDQKTQNLFGHFAKHTACNPSGNKKKEKMQLPDTKTNKRKMIFSVIRKKEKENTHRTISQNKNAY